jgi:hypothetical protein
MKIVCLHGYFIVTEHAVGDIATFNSLYEQDLTAKDDHYTFSAISDVPLYSLLATPFLGNTAIQTYADHRPWELFRKNQLVYNFLTGQVVPIASQMTYITELNRVKPAYLQSKSLFMPGSVTTDWQQITGYVCSFDVKSSNYYYSDIFYE